MKKSAQAIRIILGVIFALSLDLAVAQGRAVQTLTYSHGKYVGEVASGRANGQGTYTAAKSGTIYSGQFINDTFTGNGTMTWPNGDRFVGSWQNDSAVSGTMTFANGRTASGTVHNGIFTESRNTVTTKPAPQPIDTRPATNTYGFGSRSYTIVFSCEDSYGAGRDSALAENLISALQQGGGYFSSMMSTSTFMTYCKPATVNMTNLSLLKNGRLFSKSNGVEYILIKQGNTATFGVIGR